MTIREMTAYQIVCDHCGRTEGDLGAEYSSWDDADDANEAWADATGELTRDQASRCIDALRADAADIQEEGQA